MAEKFCSLGGDLFRKYAVPYRISGHETFPCRYTWLPKAVRGVAKNPRLLFDEPQAMVELGVGKNMVGSIRFWSQAADIVELKPKSRAYQLTRGT